MEFDQVTAPSGPGRVGVSEGLMAAMSLVPEPVVVTDLGQRIVYVNRHFTALTGYVPDEVLGRNRGLLDGPGTDRVAVAHALHAVAHGDTCGIKTLSYRKGGARFWDALTLAPVTDGRGAVTHVVGLHHDVTEHVEAQQRAVRLLEEAGRQRASSRSLFDVAHSLNRQTSIPALAQAVADAVPGLCTGDRAAFALWEPAEGQLRVTATAGFPDTEATSPADDILKPESSPELAQVLGQHRPVLATRAASSPWAHGQLDRFGLSAFLATPVHSGDELVGLILAGWVATGAPSEIDPLLAERMSGLASIAAIALDNARLLAAVRRTAEHDPLTDLPNRTLLQERLSDALEKLPPKQSVAVIYCDIDRFKRTNDVLGHGAGDAVLQEVAARIRRSARPQDTVARIGGDEFVIALSGLRDRGAVETVLKRLAANLAMPVTVQGQPLHITLSTGTAISSTMPGRLSPTQLAEAMVSAADIAMYQGRTAQGALVAPIWLPDQVRLDNDLHSAIQTGQIVPHYQPQIDLQTGDIVAVEALARWAHPELGGLLPGRFIPLAEANGLIIALGLHILNEACRFGAELHRQGTALEVAVNVSTRQLATPGFADDVRETLDRTGLPPRNLTLEITETRLATHYQLLRGQIRDLRDLGANVSIDDFGTGYASLARLQSLPINELKIDRSFIQGAADTGPRLLAGILGLGRGLDLRVVAEGIETPDQLALVRDLGCDRAQGNGIGHPIPAAGLHRLIRGR